MQNSNPCDSHGTVKVEKGNKAFTSYKNVIEKLKVAERNISQGTYPETHIKLAKKNMLSVLKKEPNADLSELCARLKKIEKDAQALIPEPETEYYDPCEKGGGTLKFQEGDKGYKKYLDALANVKQAESYARAEHWDVSSYVRVAKESVFRLLEEEPSADISELCGRLKTIESDPKSLQDMAKYFEEQYAIVKSVYFDESHSAYPDELGLEYPDWFIKKTEGFNREELLSKARASDYKEAKLIVEILDDYSAFLDRQGVGDYLMDLLDQQNNASSDQLAKKAKETNQLAEALKSLAGSNASMDRVIAFTQKQLGKADAALSNIYSSPTHKEYINQVVFTKKPFRPGGEGSLEINPTFKAGDAVYATVYLSASIKNAIDSWKGNGKGGTMGLKVKNSNGDFLNRKFEAWEVSSYSNYEVSISDNTSKEQTIVQFVLIPNKESSIETEMACKNITPILMARGLSLESERLKTYSVEISSSGQVTGPMIYKGNFKMDLAAGDGPAYYNTVENLKMEALLESNALPTATIKNASLEATLLTEMKKQGFQEQFQKTYIQTKWQLFEPPFKEAYKEMKASFTYTTSEGKCGWQTYSFRSFKNGSGGWTAPQKWGGADQRQRVSCNKIK
ncbi:hypothetical protein [Spongiivirga sp. MCCC 1A20706]|uniref:hypothetical protein n=1 Tax=Spongiivirga sp. MCCC 1A20706 TaxID=3160963 RepID=UPI003977D789